MGWYIITQNLDKPNWTAHKNPLCGQLMKFKSSKCKLPKHLTFRKDIGVHAPCNACATLERVRWWMDRSEYFKEHPEMLHGYMKLKRLNKLHLL